MGLILAGWALLPLNFWGGVAAVCFGFLILFVNVLLLERSRSFRRLRYFIAVGLGGALVWFCWFAFRGAPLNVTATAFPLGQETDLRVYLANDSRVSYDNVDLSLDADAYLLNVVQLSSLPKCTITVFGQPDASVEVDQPRSAPRRITLPVRITLGLPRRILCDGLPPGTAIELDFTTAAKPIAQWTGPVIVVRAKPEGDAHNPPTEVTISGTYTANFRARHISQVVTPPSGASR